MGRRRHLQQGQVAPLGLGRIKNNYANGQSASGGLFNAGTATMNDTSGILDNADGGVGNYGTLTLNDESSIRDNFFSGVYNGAMDGTGVLILNGSSVISGHSNGVQNDSDSVTMNDSSANPWQLRHRWGYGSRGLQRWHAHDDRGQRHLRQPHDVGLRRWWALPLELLRRRSRRRQLRPADVRQCLRQHPHRLRHRVVLATLRR